jgi:hypothetical protein
VKFRFIILYNSTEMYHEFWVRICRVTDIIHKKLQLLLKNILNGRLLMQTKHFPQTYSLSQPVTTYLLQLLLCNQITFTVMSLCNMGSLKTTSMPHLTLLTSTKQHSTAVSIDASRSANPNTSFNMYTILKRYEEYSNVNN